MVGLLGVAGALEEQQQRLVPGRLAGREHPLDARTDVVPDLRPHLAGRPAQRPRVLAAQGVAAVGVVAEEGQLRPHAIHIENRDDSRMLTAVRRLCGQSAGRPERRRRPVDPGQVAADFIAVAGNVPAQEEVWAPRRPAYA